MSIIEYHQGCEINQEGCFGSQGNFYTIFGTELRFLTNHLTISLIVGLVLFLALSILKKKQKIKLPFYLILIISLAAAVFLFLLLAYFFRVRVFY